MTILSKRVKGLMRGHTRPGDMNLKGTYGGVAKPKKGGGKHMRRNCSDCLWNWQNVHTGKGRVCYHNISERYHKRAGGAACSAFEIKVSCADTDSDK